MEWRGADDESGERSRRFSESGMPEGARKVAIVVFENFSLTEVCLIVEMLRIGNELALGDPKKPAFSVAVLSSRQALVPSGSFVQLFARATAAHDARLFETVFVAGGAGARAASHDADLLSWLRELPGHALVMGLAPGAEAILSMSGRTGNPVAGYKVLADDSAVWRAVTCTRTTGEGRGTVQYELAVDAVLSMVRSDFGPRVALELERRVNSHLRMNFVDTAGPGSNDKRILSDRIAWSVRWIHENSEHPVSVADLARHVSMSERNFLRRFKREIGQTPSEYLTRVRIYLARRLLVDSDLPLDKIARRCGLFNGDHLRKLFQKHFLMSPADYRRTARNVLEGMHGNIGASPFCQRTECSHGSDGCSAGALQVERSGREVGHGTTSKKTVGVAQRMT
ncbi:bacterial regulatory helix-turn-helix s, AraC family protein [Burkholderia thailandensis MSMB121]|uniref:GlxA family transcriptional regulator n=1 Tax=Burkholderia TaxID=32008 RepID=UPI0003280AC3|nr:MULTISPECIES: helix-turn-helix domain-containing protein [Burkholderia]AGK46892.1 bacterial regulatory helix-turn-helix s, AraC family protein [Burkholderia thailandensis MSMB121]ATF36922.1 AraC family transcriptional regulator [Burkholderia thailandensis]KST74297.1 AraC family transcriptional regulator [Burkholderia humptydooensis]